MEKDTIKFCGIRFWNASTDALIEQVFLSGGLVVVPSAPALCDGHDDYAYLRAHWRADYAVIDSAYLAFLMAWQLKRPVKRISGLKLLQKLFAPGNLPTLRTLRILWVAPSDVEAGRIREFSERLGFRSSLQRYYTAPNYDNEAALDDRNLLAEVTDFQPQFIVIGIGGGKQEKLGYFLRRNAGKSAAVFCTGAALAFLTGGQASIPTWVDRAFLGWLVRIVDQPFVFGARYGKALRLPWMLSKTAKNARALSIRARSERARLREETALARESGESVLRRQAALLARRMIGAPAEAGE